jgi:hypothetical protein
MSLRPNKRLLEAFALAVATLGCAQSSNVTRAEEQPARTEVKQPIAFSHKLHAQQKLDCASCHDNPDPGESMTIPDAEFCMNCHQGIATEKPAVKQLAQFAQEKKPIPWVRIYSLPAFVFWSHRTHLAARQVCTACHGDVKEMDTIRPTKVTSMDACIDCHDKKDANAGCATCHESRTS